MNEGVTKAVVEHSMRALATKYGDEQGNNIIMGAAGVVNYVETKLSTQPQAKMKDYIDKCHSAALAYGRTYDVK